MTFCYICEALVSFKSTELLRKMEGLYRGLMAGLRSLTINIPGTAYHHALKVNFVEMINESLFLVDKVVLFALCLR